MRITVYFHFDHDPEPLAETGVEGSVSDFILPGVGDTVRHSDFSGSSIFGRVRERIFTYELSRGEQVEGVVSVRILLEQIQVQ